MIKNILLLGISFILISFQAFCGGVPENSEQGEYLHVCEKGLLISPDGQTLQLRSWDNYKEVWTLSYDEHERIQNFKVNEEQSFLCVFTRGATEPPEGFLRLYDLGTREVLFEDNMIGTSIFINNIYMVWNDWFFLHSVGLDNLSGIHERITYQGKTYSSLSEIFGEDMNDIYSIEDVGGNLLLLGSSSGYIFLYKPSDNHILKSFRVSDSLINGIFKDAKQNHFMVTNYKGELYLCDYADDGLHIIRKKIISKTPVLDLIIDKSNTIVAVTKDYKVVFMDKNTLNILNTINVKEQFAQNSKSSRLQYSGINTIIKHPSKDILIIADVDRNFYIIDMKTFIIKKFEY